MRVGLLPQATPLSRLARKRKRATGAGCVAVVGDEQVLHRAIVCVGAAGSLPFSLTPGPGDVVVTGELRHHDALQISRAGATAIALSHWSSERPALRSLGDRLANACNIDTVLSGADCEPFRRV